MNYDTAKRLKDAGFKPKQGWTTFNNSLNLYSPDLLSQLVRLSGNLTLSKKIDADSDGTPVDTYSYEASSEGHSYLSDSPEESVANLWLALNKK